MAVIKHFLWIILVPLLNLSLANASSMSSISVKEWDHVVLRCFSDMGTEIELSKAELGLSENQETQRLIIGGLVRQASHSVTWTQPMAHFRMDIEAERDELSVIRLTSHISVLNPFIGEMEELNQSTISYVEFHVLKDRLHESGSAGFTSNNPSYGFGVQCFLEDFKL